MGISSSRCKHGESLYRCNNDGIKPNGYCLTHGCYECGYNLSHGHSAILDYNNATTL